MLDPITELGTRLVTTVHYLSLISLLLEETKKFILN